MSARTRTARRPLLALSAALLPWMAGTVAAQEPDAPAAGEPAESGSSEEPVDARALRLAADRDALAESLARMRALSWEGGWLDAVAAHHDPEARWVATADGYLARAALECELAWNLPGPERELPRWADVEHEPHPYVAIVDLHEQLAAVGVQLLVVPVPNRLHVYPELILPEEAAAATDWDAFRGTAEGLTSFLLRLAEAGVETVDLLPALCEDRYGEGPDGRGDQAFLKYNMHWTPRAAQRAAELVAARVRQLENFEPGKHRRGLHFELVPERASWAPANSRHQPADTVPEDLGFVKVLDPEGGSVQVEKRRNPILLLGDSFATHWSDFDASFSEHLYAGLEQPFDRIVLRGGGVYQVRRQAARREEQGVETKKIVVWLFSATTLKDADDWRTVALVGDGD